MSTAKFSHAAAAHADFIESKFVYVAAAFAALGGLLFGYDTGVISGAELFFKNDFALSTFALEVIVSGVLAGAAVGALAGGRFADLFGRRKLLIATAIIFAAGAILCASATSAAMLIVGRIIVGLGIGLSSGTVPVYISEVSPAYARGWQVSLFQLAITIGILLAYVVDFAFAKIEGWRWMFGLPVTCWKMASPMPTISAGRSDGASRSEIVPRVFVSPIVDSISFISALTFDAPRMRIKTSRARSRCPFIASQRGLSGR